MNRQVNLRLLPELSHYTSVFTHCETVDIKRACDVADTDYGATVPLWAPLE